MSLKPIKIVMSKTYNKTWIAFANSLICNHIEAIHDLKYINWRMGANFHFSIGDIVYLFISEKRSVRFKMVVVEQDCKRTDNDYWIKVAPNDITYKLALIDEYKGDKLKEEYLIQYGFSGGSIQTPSYKNVDLIAYIDSIFALEHNHDSDLQNKPIIYVDMYSGEYWKERTGHEILNLDKNSIDGRYYGYCPPHGNIDITKLGAQKGDESVSGVIVVYTAKIKSSSDREIIAFCTDATVYKEPITDISKKRIIKDNGIRHCPYHIVSDELVNLSSVTSKFVIRIAEYSVSLFRFQRFFKGKHPELDKKVIAYITNYLENGNDGDDIDFQESVQNADTSKCLIDTSEDKPEYLDGNNSKAVKKNSRISKHVLVEANYICAGDDSHTTFLTNKGVWYMEGHHLIPCTYSNANYFWNTRKRNIDCVENVVCLCPTCHRKIHFGSPEEKKTLIERLYMKQISKLSEANLAISLNELYELYGL